MDWFQLLTGAILAGCILDLLFADPESFPHPVVLMGACISRAERLIRRVASGASERSGGKDERRKLKAGGAIVAFCLPVLTFLIAGSVCLMCRFVHPVLYFLIEAFWCWQALAARGLAWEAGAVFRVLEENSISAARKQVARIVGRDTGALDEKGVVRACVETVAENFSDGVIAPFLYMLIGGAPLALAYKAINTMDSMIGYKNEKYADLGYCAAKLDDSANFLPSRIAALFWILASFLYPGADGKRAYFIWRRDRRKHASPNSAQTEAACAGAMHIQLAGPSSYFGKRVEKPYIGDPDRPVETEDIRRSVRLMWTGYALAAFSGIALRSFVFLLMH